LKSSRAFLILVALLAFAQTASGRMKLQPDEKAEPSVAITTEKAEDSKDLPARTVHFELGKVENAAGYEIQIRPYEQNWAEPYKFRIPDEKLRIRLTPAHYALRTRSFDEARHPGPWSSWKDFWIQFRPVANIFPAEGAMIEPKGSAMEKITFEWPKVDLAKMYLFQLKDSKGKVLRSIETKQTWLSVEVAISSGYSWTIIPLSREEEASVDHPDVPFHAFRVLSPNLTMRSMYFEVKPTKEAVKYQFEFVKFISDDESGEPSVFDSHEPNFRTRLGTGEYEMRARSVLPDGVTTDWSTPERFFIPFPLPKPIGPEAAEELEANDTDSSEHKLEWEPFAHVGFYRVRVYDESGKLIVDEKANQPFLTIHLKEDAKYKWSVAAYHTREPERAPASEKSEELHNFSVGTYTKLELTPAEEPSQLYGWFRYINSEASYEGYNYDLNALVRQKIWGGHADSALGFWHRKSNLGLLVTGTLSGYWPSSGMFTYYSAGLHLGYRKKYEDGGRLRVWGGASFVEIPEITANPTTQVFSVQRLKTLGPDLMVSYVNSFNDTYGWHAFGQIYWGKRDLGTPNGLPQYPRFSYSLGLMGTYKTNERMTWNLGYTFKAENAAYGSTDSPDRTNTVSLIGHYFGIALEFALQPAKK
jgi:hypothetical protein